ncbi:ABC transporter permease subunit [Thermosyntropha sp.]|uniref:ABC transporter permease n=1 Tax=Thermosyntropha sp. TaxID=2740820 RepID=UPI0025F24B15|nr:ABC transporter permease subunit [Thermosyntropha sp.]MBO8158204.1 ABC transporter permease subunit [Thermosyntropha sp.]
MFPESMEYHISSHIDAFIAWLNVAGEAQFAAISKGLLSMILTVYNLLVFIPWWIWIVLVALIYWYCRRKLVSSIILALLLMSAGIFGYWSAAMETLAVVIVAVLLAVLLGIPLGILMSQKDKVEVVLTPLLDAMQTLPSFVYLIPVLMLFGLGKVPAVLATFIYALPPVVRLTNLGIRQVSDNLVEVGEAFGANRWQLMKEILLPLSVPSILAGINQTTMMALAMVIVCSMIGAGGVGYDVLIAINRLEVGKGFEAGFVVVALAIIIDRLTQGIAQRWQNPGMAKE